MHQALTGKGPRIAVISSAATCRHSLRELARNLLAKLDDQPLGGPLANAGRRLEPLCVPRGNGSQEIARRAPGQDGDRDLGPDPRDGRQVQKEVPLLLAREAIEGQRIVACDQVGMQGRLLAPRRHRLERLRRYREAVADASRLDHHVVGAAHEHLAANRGDHPA